MKAHEALIAWTPDDSDGRTRGQVKVGPFSTETRDWTNSFDYVFGADSVDARNLRGDASLARLLSEFNYLVVRDRLDPQVVHRAFLQIDEYAALWEPGF